MFDVTRHQLMFAGPRTEHLVLEGALLATPVEPASVTVNEQRSAPDDDRVWGKPEHSGVRGVERGRQEAVLGVAAEATTCCSIASIRWGRS